MTEQELQHIPEELREPTYSKQVVVGSTAPMRSVVRDDERDMWQAMQDVGYKETTKVLTRAQVKVIVKFLGEP